MGGKNGRGPSPKYRDGIEGRNRMKDEHPGLGE